MSRDVKPPTIDDVLRELAKAKPDEAAMRAYFLGRLDGTLILVARKARVAWASGDVTVMTEALAALTVAEDAAGVDLTTPTEEDLL
ncbi:MAG TPA: hypothetical protein VLS49_13420 [Usitatibacter sp.]|nr:hypothetical protein [Usitatibacter sp.]